MKKQVAAIGFGAGLLVLALGGTAFAEENLVPWEKLGPALISLENLSLADPNAGTRVQVGLETHWGSMTMAAAPHLSLSFQPYARLFLGRFMISAELPMTTHLDHFIVGNPAVAGGVRHCIGEIGFCVGAVVRVAPGLAKNVLSSSHEDQKLAAAGFGSAQLQSPMAFGLQDGYVQPVLLVNWGLDPLVVELELGGIFAINAPEEMDQFFVPALGIGINATDWLRLVVEGRADIDLFHHSSAYVNGGVRLFLGAFSPYLLVSAPVMELPPYNQVGLSVQAGVEMRID